MNKEAGIIKLDELMVENVPSVMNWNGLNYMFVRGKEKEGKSTLFLEMDGDFNIRTKRKWFPTTFSYGERFSLLGHDADLHCFLRHKGVIFGKIVAGPGADGKPPKEIGGRESPLQTNAGLVGVASHYNGIIVVMNSWKPDKSKIDFYLTAWPNLYSRKNATEQTIELPSNIKTVAGAEAVCVMVPPSHSNSKDMELHLIWGMAYIDSKTYENGLLFGECNVKRDGELSYVDTSSIIWTKCPQEHPYRYQATMLPRMHLGIEGRAYAMTYTYQMSPTASIDDEMALFESSSSAPEVKSIHLWMREKPGKWIDLGNPLGKTKDVYMVGSVADVSGRISVTKSPVNDGLEDKTLPVKRTYFYMTQGKGNEIYYSKDDFGHLRCRGLAKIPGGQDLLLGIIQGPPPIPHENINIPDNLDPSIRGKGVTTFAKTKKEEQGYKLKGSISVIGQASGEVGAISKFHFEASLSLGYRRMYESRSGKINTTKYEVEMKLEGPKEKQSVQPYGTVILSRSEWEGYAFEYVAPAGSPSADSATTIFQVWPTGIVIVTEPYAMNPKEEPIPGNLLSYMVSPEKRKSIEEKATPLLSGTKHLTSAWSLSSKTVDSFEEYFQAKSSNSYFIDWKALLGVGWDVKEWSKAKFMGGTQITMDEEWESQREDKLGLSTSVETRGNSRAIGTYYKYTYHTYQLNSEQQWTQELLRNLVTENWPPIGSSERKINENLKKRIATGSKPWMIVYVLGDHAKIESLQDVAMLNQD